MPESSPVNVNPYEAAVIGELSSRPRRSLWRILPAVFFLLLGIAIDMLVIAVVIQILRFYREGLFVTPRPKVFIDVGVWFASGVAFIAASVFFWQAKYRRGVYTAVAAFAIFAICTAIAACF